MRVRGARVAGLTVTRSGAFKVAFWHDSRSRSKSLDGILSSTSYWAAELYKRFWASAIT